MPSSIAETQRLAQEIADHREALLAFTGTVERLSAEAWNAARPGDKWSPAQIAEHLAIIYEYNRKVLKGEAGRGAPRFLQPLARWYIVDRTLKAGRFTRKGRAPAIFQPVAKTPAPASELLARLTAAVAGLEADIRSGHPAGRHTVAHPFFGTVNTVDWMTLQAIHARHHRSQLT